MHTHAVTSDDRSPSATMPVAIYFALAFLISWSLVLLVVLPGGFPGTPESVETGFGPAYLGMLAGPTIGFVAVAFAFFGRAGLSDVFRSVAIWRVRPLYYLIAVALVPSVAITVLSVFSFTSDRFVPQVLTPGGGLSLLLTGLAIGIVAGAIEELGWTGFAMRRLLTRHSVLAVGLVVGVLHGAWHLLVDAWLNLGIYGDLYPLYFLIAWVCGLTGLRLIIAFLVARTGSTLIAQIAHASYSGGLMVLWPTAPAPVETMAWTGTFAAVLLMIGLALTRYAGPVPTARPGSRPA